MIKNNFKEITHTIPLVGLKNISIYEPANKILEILVKSNEIKRQKLLLHLGALVHSFPGSRQVRWDYTVIMLYYTNLLNFVGAKSKIKLDKINFSSLITVLQSLILVWNIGHVPGTFSVEKGISKFLFKRNPNEPASLFNWPNRNIAEIQKIIKNANNFLLNQDYLGVSRVLAVLKMLKIDANNEWFLNWIYSVAAPFLLDYEESDSYKWNKINNAFRLIRHCAYLTLDYSISGINWGPDIPNLINQFLTYKEKKYIEKLVENISEILSPIERQIYQNIYHHPVARKEVALVSNKVFKYLDMQKNPNQIIDQWIELSDFSQLNIRNNLNFKNCNRVASFKLRSHFSFFTQNYSTLELELLKKKFQFPVIFEYRSWNSDVVLEPDEVIVDVITSKIVRPEDIGKLLSWLIYKFESFNIDYFDDFELYKKLELSPTYLELLIRAVELSFPNVQVRFQPWQLSKFGILKDYSFVSNRGGIWASNSLMNDPIIKHILRKRRKKISNELITSYWELQGISFLRDHLRKKWRRKNLRQKCLIITGSIRFFSDDRDIIEYDGGILTVSSRSGKLNWYGLESKSGNANPKNSLERRLSKLNIKYEIYSINNDYAYVKIPLSNIQSEIISSNTR